MRAAAQALALGAMAIGKYFGDKNPNYGSLTDRVCGDEGEDANRHDQEVTGKELSLIHILAVEKVHCSQNS